MIDRRTLSTMLIALLLQAFAATWLTIVVKPSVSTTLDLSHHQLTLRSRHQHRAGVWSGCLDV